MGTAGETIVHILERHGWCHDGVSTLRAGEPPLVALAGSASPSGRPRPTTYHFVRTVPVMERPALTTSPNGAANPAAHHQTPASRQVRTLRRRLLRRYDSKI